MEELDFEDDEVSIVTTPLARTRTLLPTLAALAVAFWLVSSRFLNGQMADPLTELQWMAFTYLALPALIWSLILSAAHLWCAPAGGRRKAVLPLAISLLALALYAVPTPLIEQMDYERNRAARLEVVRRIEAGELWNGSPYIELVSLPRREYAQSVTNGAGQDCVTVYREDGALNVVFYPVAGGILDRDRPIIYRSDGRPPALPAKQMEGAVSSEPLGEGWHRLSYSGRDDLVYVSIALMVGYLTIGSSIVAIPLAFGIHRLAHPRGRGESPVRP